MQSMCLMLLKSFEDIPGYGVMENFLAVSEETVRTNFEMYQALDSKVIFHKHKGLFNDTVPQFRAKNSAAKIAVFRVDGNFYGSYHDALYYVQLCASGRLCHF